MYEIDKDSTTININLDALSRIQYEDKITKLKNKIERLDRDKQIEIFNKLHKKDVIFSENRNGIFINMNDIPKSVIIELILYIDYIEKQDELLKTIEREKTSMEKTFMDS